METSETVVVGTTVVMVVVWVESVTVVLASTGIVMSVTVAVKLKVVVEAGPGAAVMVEVVDATATEVIV